MLTKRHLSLAIRTLVLTLAVSTVSAIFLRTSAGQTLQGRVVGAFWKAAVPWRIIDQDEVERGASIPASTNTIIHLPISMERTVRETLLGERGSKVRYWGYCFPENYDPQNMPQIGYPGKVFLSEAERAAREALNRSQWPVFSIYNPPTREDLARTYISGRIRHQIESFGPGETCYIMSEQSLPVGPDRDGDRLNAALEKHYGTDPTIVDTDGDGLSDGVEAFNLHTDPLRRDSDADGLIDGLEVHLHDHILAGDTNPLHPDSDADGLCDGYCRSDKSIRLCKDFSSITAGCIDTPPTRWSGEDRNLNGIVDKGETNPLMYDSNNNNISDLQEYYNCLLKGGASC